MTAGAVGRRRRVAKIERERERERERESADSDTEHRLLCCVLILTWGD
jgi:hypothetical protein